MASFVVNLRDVQMTQIDLVGRKGANLGELSRIDGINVPEGFCISTAAFKKVLDETPSITELLDDLSTYTLEERSKISRTTLEIRTRIQEVIIPQDILEQIVHFIDRFGEANAYAVRSSGTAEDLPGASFAGQHDTYLNVVGMEAILKQIRNCWASMFNERAVTYRFQNCIDHRKVFACVVIQKMVFPQASGIMFTADPVSCNRKVLSIDASFGLGEALVDGVVNPDIYKVRDNEVLLKKISNKKLAVYASEGGGTNPVELPAEQQIMEALNDSQILELARIGRKVEAHFESPQDIEWCFLDDVFYLLQSRPITTLFPVPRADDQGKHLYVSVGHQQMMTDPMKPLVLSFLRLSSARPMYEGGGRLFVDVLQQLSSSGTRELVLDALGKSDPLIKDALINILERQDFVPPPIDAPNARVDVISRSSATVRSQRKIEYSPQLVLDLMKRSHTSQEALEQKIRSKSGLDLLTLIEEDIQILKQSLFDPEGMGVIMAALDASSWINEKMSEWLAEPTAADTLCQSVPNNVTSEMGFALLDLAEVISRYPEVVAYLQRLKDDDYLIDLGNLSGGAETQRVLDEFLAKYGMRCTGEIDITRPRWCEKPATLVPLILSSIRNCRPGAGRRRFDEGKLQAKKKEQFILDRLRVHPEGEEKVFETKRMIEQMRNLIGYREYPKYVMMNRYFSYKQALLKEAEELVQSGILHEKEDIYYLTFQEVRAVLTTKNVDHKLISKRKEEYESYERLTPPRVITSDGEIIKGEYRRGNIPAGAIVGLAVSSGVVEGRARVIVKMEDGDLEAGDILITAFTDPSWTPLFLSVKGLVTEVGGLMTHGAVIAREYGLPAIVGVENATKLIKDKQRIRLDGTNGYIEII